jgi:hypothetical protein
MAVTENSGALDTTAGVSTKEDLHVCGITGLRTRVTPSIVIPGGAELPFFNSSAHRESSLFVIFSKPLLRGEEPGRSTRKHRGLGRQKLVRLDPFHSKLIYYAGSTVQIGPPLKHTATPHQFPF